MAELQRANASLSQEVIALKAERERLINALEIMFPPPTEQELADAEANPGQLTRFIDQLAADMGVANAGR